MKILYKLLFLFLLAVGAQAQTAFTLQGYDSAATTLTLQFGGGNQLPAAPVTCYYWDWTQYGSSATSDPQLEVILVSVKNGDIITVVRGYLSSAFPHNVPGDAYAIQQASSVTPIPTNTPTKTSTPTFTSLFTNTFTNTPAPGAPTNTSTPGSSISGPVSVANVAPSATPSPLIVVCTLPPITGSVSVSNFPTLVPTNTPTITPTLVPLFMSQTINLANSASITIQNTQAWTQLSIYDTVTNSSFIPTALNGSALNFWDLNLQVWGATAGQQSNDTYYSNDVSGIPSIVLGIGPATFVYTLSYGSRVNNVQFVGNPPTPDITKAAGNYVQLTQVFLQRIAATTTQTPPGVIVVLTSTPTPTFTGSLTYTPTFTNTLTNTWTPLAVSNPATPDITRVAGAAIQLTMSADQKAIATQEANPFSVSNPPTPDQTQYAGKDMQLTQTFLQRIAATTTQTPQNCIIVLTATPTPTFTGSFTYTSTFTLTPTNTWTPLAVSNPATPDQTKVAGKDIQLTQTFLQGLQATITNTPTPNGTAQGTPQTNAPIVFDSANAYWWANYIRLQYTGTPTLTAVGTLTPSNTPTSTFTPNLTNTITPTPSWTNTPVTVVANPTVNAGKDIQLTQVFLQNIQATTTQTPNNFVVVLTATPTNTPTFPAGTNTPTSTPTFTPWYPLVAKVTEATALTPTPINTPITNKATSLIIDSLGNQNAGSVQILVTANGIAVAKLTAGAAGASVPSLYMDNSGGVTWGFANINIPSSEVDVNYRLWVAPIGTPPPWPLR